jgi:uncharacterized protein
MPRKRSVFIDLESAQLPALEVRTVTLAINCGDLADRQLHRLCEGLYQRVTQRAIAFVEACGQIAGEWGIPILQRRVCVTPLDRIMEGFGADDLVNIGRTLDGAAGNARLDQIAGYLARCSYGLSTSSRQLIATLPSVLSQTTRLQAAVEVARTDAGLNIDAIELLGRKVRETAQATADRQGSGAARLSAFANLPGDGPPLSGLVLGDGWGDLVVHISVSAMGPLRQAIQHRLSRDPQANLTTLAAEVKSAGFQAVRVAEMVGREIARRLGADFGRVDVSLAPTVRPGQTIAELLEQLGVAPFGMPGTAAALTLLWGALRAAGAFGSTAMARHSAILLPILRDAGLVTATEAGSLAVEHLEQLAAVGGLGLDLIPVPGDTSAGTLSAVIADTLSTAVVGNRPGLVRLVPVPGHTAGERVSFGRDLGDALVLPLTSLESSPFVRRGGHIPTA